MFPLSKYSIYYNSIIRKALNSTRDKTQEYFERHHILPKCLGGSNKQDNLVLLTPREHFICHALLVKMYKDQSFERSKLLHAFMLMKGKNSKQIRYINAKIYDSLKKEFSENQRKRMTGRKISPEHKDKIGLARKGKKMSQETKNIIAEKAKLRKRKPFTPEQKLNISRGMKRLE